MHLLPLWQTVCTLFCHMNPVQNMYLMQLDPFGSKSILRQIVSLEEGI